jgi:hypothetical protein
MKDSLTEHRKGGPDRTYKAGEVLTESTDVDHWAENTTAEPVTVISADLFKEQVSPRGTAGNRGESRRSRSRISANVNADGHPRDWGLKRAEGCGVALFGSKRRLLLLRLHGRHQYMPVLQDGPQYRSKLGSGQNGIADAE